MAGTARRGGQIAWVGLKLGVAVLRLRRRAPDLLPAYVSTTLVGLGTTFVKLGQGWIVQLARVFGSIPELQAERDPIQPFSGSSSQSVGFISLLMYYVSSSRKADP